jgi:hypothetical protein
MQLCFFPHVDAAEHCHMLILLQPAEGPASCCYFSCRMVVGGLSPLPHPTPWFIPENMLGGKGKGAVDAAKVDRDKTMFYDCKF